MISGRGKLLNHFSLFACLVVLAIMPLACSGSSSGGGGGGGGGSNPGDNPGGDDPGGGELTDVLKGAFSGAMICSDENLPDPVYTSEISDLNFDGLGEYSGNAKDNTNGQIGTEVLGGLYSVDADGTLHMSEGGVKDHSLTGVMVDNGAVAFLDRDGDGEDPGLSLFLKREGNYTWPDLRNDYFIVGYNFELDPYPQSSAYSETGLVHYYPDGTFVVKYLVVEESGKIVFSYEYGYYTLFTNGSFGLDNYDGTKLEGGLIPGGLVGVATSTNKSSDPQVVVMLKKLDGEFSNTMLQGTYHVIGLGFDFDGNPPLQYSLSGTLSADGQGGYSMSLSRNNQGSIKKTNSDGSYTVDPEGYLELQSGTGKLVKGGILHGGGMAVLGAATKGEDPGILILIKK